MNSARMTGNTANGTGGAPSVDVLMLAYNVEPFIAEAVRGVLSQIADFPIRLVIAEDGSTDGTRTICERLAKGDPDRILYLPGATNIGIAARTVEGLARCTAEYVAICDSDDRWTDPRKLAEQVAFLEAHPDHGLSYTDVAMITREGVPLAEDGYDGVRADYASGDVFVKLLQGNFINNSTTLVRRELLHDLRPNACRDDLIGDYVRWLQIAIRTKVYFVPRKTTAYRLGGVTSKDTQARNRRVMRSLLGELLLEYERTAPRLDASERAILFRKTIGAVVRGGTVMPVRAALFMGLFKYLPAMIANRRVLPGKSGSRQ